MGERPEWPAATMLMDEFLYEDTKGYIAASSLKDCYYILSKYADEASAREYVLALMDLFEVVPVDATICRMAALSNEPDFEDGIVRMGAESVPVDFIISRDEAAFRRSRIKRLTAREYLELFTPMEEIEFPA